MTMYNPALGDADEFLGANLGLIGYMMNRYRNHRFYDESEFYSLGLYALTNAYVSFNPLAGCTFATYAVAAITRQFNRYIRDQNAVKRTGTVISLDAHIADSERHDLTLGDMLEGPAGDFTRPVVEEFIGSLKESEREILHLRMAGDGQVEIAKRVHVSQPQVSKVLRRIGRKYQEFGA